eukprot:1082922-Rhodomonas_salina.2
MDPAGTGKASIWHFRDLVESLHILCNPMGSCALVDGFKHRQIRAITSPSFCIHTTTQAQCQCMLGR